MRESNFEMACGALMGNYDRKSDACTITKESFVRYQIEQRQRELLKEAAQNRLPRNIKEIKSKRDTNIDSFNTYDEVLDENGTIAIRRPDSVVINNYGSIKFS